MSSKKELLVVGDSFCVDLQTLYLNLPETDDRYPFAFKVRTREGIKNIPIDRSLKPFPIHPEIIAKELNLKLVNLSRNGAGNDYIFAHALDYLSKNKKKIEKVIIAWSGWYREDVEIDIWVNAINGFPQQTQPPEWSSLADLYPHPNKINSINKFFRYVYLIQTVCERFDIDYRMMQTVGIGSISAPHMLNKDIDDTKKAKEILDHEYFDLINYHKFIGWPVIQNLGGFTMLNLIEPNEFPIHRPTDLYLNNGENVEHPDCHPNAEGQRLIAKYILDTL